MTDNMKNFLEAASRDREACAKLCELDQAALIAMAKEMGFVLTEADFEQKVELAEEELDAVAGGGECVCVVGGGGTAGESDRTCGCVAYGFGTTKYGDRCHCALGGYGYGDLMR